MLEAIRLLDLQIDVLHANDWQTGLIPAYLKIEYRGVPGYEHIATLLTIHNLAYQGQFWHWDMLLTGLDWKYFNWHQMEFFGKLNLLKTGLVFADAINTVSPRYAEEIQTLAAGLRAGRSAAAAARRALGHSQRRRLRASGIRRPIAHLPVQLRRRDGRSRARPPARRRCKQNWGCRSTRGRAAGRLRRPADRSEGLGPDRRGHAGLGRRPPTCSGWSWARAKPKYRTVADDAWPSVIPHKVAVRLDSPTRWPTGSRPAPTSS